MNVGLIESIRETIIEGFKALGDWALAQLDEYLPFDIEDIDPVSWITFANDHFAVWNQVLPIYQCLGILLTGLGVKYSIRAGRLLLGFIPGVHG